MSRNGLSCLLFTTACSGSSPSARAPDTVGDQAVAKTDLSDVTAALVVASADGKVPAAQLIDPSMGVYKLFSLQAVSDEGQGVEVHGFACDTAAINSATQFAAAMRDAATRGKADGNHVIACAPAATVAASAILCSSPSAVKYDVSYGLLFLPDPARGVRIAGVMQLDVGAEPDRHLAELAAATAKTGAQCPR